MPLGEDVFDYLEKQRVQPKLGPTMQNRTNTIGNLPRQANTSYPTFNIDTPSAGEAAAAIGSGAAAGYPIGRALAGGFQRSQSPSIRGASQPFPRGFNPDMGASSVMRGYPGGYEPTINMRAGQNSFPGKFNPVIESGRLGGDFPSRGFNPEIDPTRARLDRLSASSNPRIVRSGPAFQEPPGGRLPTGTGGGPQIYRGGGPAFQEPPGGRFSTAASAGAIPSEQAAVAGTETASGASRIGGMLRSAIKAPIRGAFNVLRRTSPYALGAFGVSKVAQALAPWGGIPENKLTELGREYDLPFVTKTGEFLDRNVAPWLGTNVYSEEVGPPAPMPFDQNDLRGAAEMLDRGPGSAPGGTSALGTNSISASPSSGGNYQNALRNLQGMGYTLVSPDGRSYQNFDAQGRGMIPVDYWNPKSVEDAARINAMALNSLRNPDEYATPLSAQRIGDNGMGGSGGLGLEANKTRLKFMAETFEPLSTFFDNQAADAREAGDDVSVRQILARKNELARSLYDQFVGQSELEQMDDTGRMARIATLRQLLANPGRLSQGQYEAYRNQLAALENM